MKKVVNDPRLIYKCCKLYYEEFAGQQEIADRLGVSRVSVSRMLKAGRDMGIVVIKVVSPNQLDYGRLEQELERIYGLKEVVVVENSPLATQYDHLTALGTGTIELLEGYLHDNEFVGVSMGMTLHNVSRCPRKNTDNINCTFVPIIGGISSGRTQAGNIHSNQIAFDFAKLFGAQYVDFFSPAIFSDKKVLEGFMREAPMRKIQQYYKEIKTVIMGIGIPDRAGSTMIKAGYINAEQLNELSDKGITGDLSLQFYDIEGRTEPFHEFNDRVAGMPLEQLRRVENKIGIGSGLAKANAIYGALQGGYINILVTDEECARKLIELGKDERKNVE